MKNIIFASIMFTLLGTNSAMAGFTNGSISCSFGKIKISGNFSRSGLTLTDAGVFRMEDLCDKSFLAESWPSGISSLPWATKAKGGVVEYDIGLSCNQDHNIPYESLNLPAVLKAGANPAYLQTLLVVNGQYESKKYNGKCNYIP